MGSSARWVGLVLVCAALIASSGTSPTALAGTAGRPMLWGASVEQADDSVGTEAREAAIQELEAEVGRRFDIDRQFRRWDLPFPDDYDTWTRDQGRTLVL